VCLDEDSIHGTGVEDFSIAITKFYQKLTHLVSPNGVAFVKPHLRKSVLAKMLQELLDTRVMVKSAMKRHKHKKV
jgi:DNA polymerase elongation subunit (family B)